MGGAGARGGSRCSAVLGRVGEQVASRGRPLCVFVASACRPMHTRVLYPFVSCEGLCVACLLCAFSCMPWFELVYKCWQASWVWGRHWQHVWVVWARARCQGLLSCASRFEAPVVRYQIVAIWPSGNNYNLELQPPGAPGSNVMLGTTGARPPVASKVIQLIGWGSDGV